VKGNGKARGVYGNARTMLSIAFLGDLVVGRTQIDPEERLCRFCHECDFAIVNLEGPIIDRARPRSGKRRPLWNGRHVVRILRCLNVKVAVLANNHIMDFDEEGLTETIETLERAGIRWVGCGTSDGRTAEAIQWPNSDLIIAAYAQREGPMAEEGRAGPIPLPAGQILRAQIKEWKRVRKKVILSYHGGEEFFTTPWPRRAAAFEAWRRAGASVVFGHHAHAAQPIVHRHDGVIMYGVGNLYMDTPYQRRHARTDLGIAVRVGLDSSVTVAARHVHAERDGTGRLRLGKKVEIGGRMPMDAEASQWCRQCRARLWWGGPHRLRPGPLDLAKGPLRLGHFIGSVCRQQLQRDVNRRDLDIMFSALPIYGPRFARQTAADLETSFNF
jgi:hypothetical protein